MAKRFEQRTTEGRVGDLDANGAPSKRDEILSIAAQLMAADVPAFSIELRSSVDSVQNTVRLITEKCDAYVTLAAKLVEAIDRWQAKQPKPEATLPPRKLPPNPDCT